MNGKIQKRKLLDDLPADIDALDFKPYIDTLADIISSSSTSTPLTIGVFGTWGSGKTSLMRMVCNQLPKSFRTTWFDAWKYNRQEDLWRVLLLQTLNTIEGAIPDTKDEQAKQDREKLANMRMALYSDINRKEVGRIEIDGEKLVATAAKGAIRIGISFLPGVSTLTKLVKELHKGAEISEGLFDAIRRERIQIHIDQIKFLEDFHNKFTELVHDYLQVKNQRLVVFVDDLDRCLPEKVVEVLEAIKMFLDVPGCIFVLGIDQQVVARGIEIKYKEFGLPMDGKDEPKFMIEGIRYLEKIIQLPFQIPPIEREDMSEFITGLIAGWPHEECPMVFSEGLGDNPRKVKRTVNVFLLLWLLANRRKDKLKGEIKPVRLAKIVVIQNIFPKLYEHLKRTPRLLRDLEIYYRQAEKIGQRREIGIGKEESRIEGQRNEPPPSLAGFVNRVAVRRILTMHSLYLPDANFTDLKPTELRSYFTLTRRAEEPIFRAAEQIHQVYEPEMIYIPAGSFLMGSTEEQTQSAFRAGLNVDWVAYEKPQHKIELPSYMIGRYSVTNAEYVLFVAETTHNPPPYWDGNQCPEDKSDHPVVNVSWYDAIAYCKWLSEMTGKAYRLPTEAEWEKAARGENGQLFPWGDKFDQALCNAKGSGVGTTTPVAQYSPLGDSLYGLSDMAGNVWEWTHSLYKKYPYDPSDGREEIASGELRVLRGGSFFSPTYNLRCARRGWEPPNNWTHFWGFRIVL